MPFAVPFELNMFVPFEIGISLEMGEIPCEVHFAVHYLRSNGTHLWTLIVLAFTAVRKNVTSRL